MTREPPDACTYADMNVSRVCTEQELAKPYGV